MIENIKEVFKPICGFEGLYEISNLGRVKSFNYLGKHETNYLKPGISYGYYVVSLSKNGVHKMKKVHRLVAEAFLPNPNNYGFINHKIEGDEGKRKNFVMLDDNGDVLYSTIEWCDQKYNNTYGSVKKRQSDTLMKKSAKKIEQYSLDGKLVKIWDSQHLIKIDGIEINKGYILRCCKGKNKTAYNFIWKFSKK